ncbi:hypothetical protein FDP41_000892 [Naegleria fowleri]|uniref:Guanylate cyclase domain-containing protein n=1 Tax=Naegleria fowleri TaxID=5763 RepID=A0A6A5C379_NAEFO|nr:uncharacterized protein FDP41_000892 [Naegleria fowleri]KAF0979739.1 hypothetical protein FDP41_000892 [Naegleria fowleri]CAG4718358.1 unnamed protein product [Naegleria fowleri]
MSSTPSRKTQVDVSARIAGYRIKRKTNQSNTSLKSSYSTTTTTTTRQDPPTSDPSTNTVIQQQNADHTTSHNTENHNNKNDNNHHHNTNGNSTSGNIFTNLIMDPYSRFGCWLFRHHPCSLLTIANVVLILFLFQGGLGLITSFTFMYSTGQSIVNHEVKFTQIQSEYTMYNGIEKFVDCIDEFVQHFYSIGPTITLTNDIAMLSLLEYLATASTKNDKVTYSIDRADGYSISKEFHNGVPTIRILNPFNKTSSVYEFPSYFYTTEFKDSYLLSTLGIAKYQHLPSILGNAIETKFQNNSRSDYKMRFESQFKNQSNPVWMSGRDKYTALLIPVYVNARVNRTAPLNNVKIVNVIEHPEAKNISQLLMVVSLRLPTDSISQLINMTSHLQYVSKTCTDSFVINSRGYILSSNESSCPFRSDTFETMVSSNLLQYLKSGPCNSSSDDHHSRNNTIMISPKNSTIDPDSITFSEDSSMFQFQFLWKNRKIYVEVTPLCGLYGLDWAVVQSQEVYSFLDEIISNGINSIIIFIFVLILEAFFLFFLVTGFNFSFNKLNKQLKNLVKLKNLKFDENIVKKPENVGTQDVDNQDSDGKQSYSIFSDLRRVEIGVHRLSSVVNIICKFVPDIVLQKFVNNVELDHAPPTYQNISLVKIQIEGLLDIVEQKGLDVLEELSSEYFRVIPKIVQDHGGMIQLYDDMIIAIFNEESYPIERHEIHAVHAVLDSLLIFKEIQEKWQQKYLNQISLLKLRASIHSGEVLCGSIGSTDHLHYTILGRDFTVSQKLLEMASDLNQSVLISEETYCKVKDAFICYFVDSINLSSGNENNHEQYIALGGESNDNQNHDSTQFNDNNRPIPYSHILKLYSVECSRNESTDLQKKICLDLEQTERAISEKRFEVALNMCERVMQLSDQPHVLHLHKHIKGLCQSSRIK